jgi:PAS domain S-box-containing protein
VTDLPKPPVTAAPVTELSFRELVENLPVAAWSAQADGHIDYYNAQWYSYTGTTFAEMAGWGWQAVHRPDMLEGVMTNWTAAVRGGKPFVMEFPLRNGQGEFRWFLTRAWPLRNSQGTVVRWCGTNTDIHEQKQAQQLLATAEEEIREFSGLLEARVKERTAQLQEANRELEAFSYSVSHDLRAPLRHVLGFAQMLQRHAWGSLDEKARGYVTTIKESAARGGQLVDDLLAFSRVGRAALKQERVELQPLIAEIIAGLCHDIGSRKIQWQVGPLPAVQGDLSLLRAAFVNLLDNALKYSRPTQEAVIGIGAQLQDNTATLWFTDNGVGFDSRYSHKLFGVFSRLHAAEAFEGTGIGLANVRRIVQRHGGKVWAQSPADRQPAGATFYVTLPLAAPASSLAPAVRSPT